jgi:hypothetical protein
MIYIGKTTKLQKEERKLQSAQQLQIQGVHTCLRQESELLHQPAGTYLLSVGISATATIYSMPSCMEWQVVPSYSGFSAVVLVAIS